MERKWIKWKPEYGILWFGVRIRVKRDKGYIEGIIKDWSKKEKDNVLEAYIFNLDDGSIMPMTLDGEFEVLKE